MNTKNPSFIKEFDLDLKYGEAGEEWLRLLPGTGKIEVKTERHWWTKTGNVFFEYECRGAPSGLAVTTANWWCHILQRGDQRVLAYIWHIPILKASLKRMYAEGKAIRTVGGDYRNSVGLLVPVKELYLITALEE